MNLKLKVLGSLILLAFAGCASVPVVHDPSGVDVAVTGLSENLVMMYYGQGGVGEPDPYIAASGLLSGLLPSQKQDFVVLRIEIASLIQTHVDIYDVGVKDAKGADAARLFTKQEFLELLRSQSLDDQVLNGYKLKLDQTYFPDGGVEIKAGKRSYVAVLVGRHPLPTPLSVEASIDLGFDAPRVFRFQWTN
jgi:hypothetical protein